MMIEYLLSMRCAVIAKDPRGTDCGLIGMIDCDSERRLPHLGSVLSPSSDHDRNGRSSFRLLIGLNERRLQALSQSRHSSNLHLTENKGKILGCSDEYQPALYASEYTYTYVCG